MNLQVFDRLDSTSSEVERQICDACEDLAILAHTQSSGRGQRGHSWQSLTGNIHLSLGLKRLLPPAALPLVPAQVSLAICKYFAENHAFRLTIKWPNDLLFDAAKIGGILCESKSTADQSWLVIGIGLNLAHSPKNVDYRTTSFREELHRALSSEKVARDLAKVIADLQFQTAYSDFRHEYESFAIMPGHRYVCQGQTFELIGYGEDGALLLQKDAELVETHSASAERRWEMQSNRRPSFLMADIGNSAIKISNGREHISMPSHGNLEKRERTALDDFFRDHRRNQLFFSSVSPSAESRLLGLLPSDIKASAIRKRWVRIRSRYPIERIGSDRLLAMEAARAMHEFRGRSLLVYSFGTATTLDVITADGEHRGGHIIPGISTMTAALHEKTDLLPNVAAALETQSVFGLSTETAISSGIVTLVTAYLDRCERLASKLVETRPVIVATGGHAAAVVKLQPQITVCEDLIFRGIETLVYAGA